MKIYRRLPQYTQQGNRLILFSLSVSFLLPHLHRYITLAYTHIYVCTLLNTVAKKVTTVAVNEEFIITDRQRLRGVLAYNCTYKNTLMLNKFT